jgi:fatty-acid desaturase
MRMTISRKASFAKDSNSNRLWKRLTKLEITCMNRITQSRSLGNALIATLSLMTSKLVRIRFKIQLNFIINSSKEHKVGWMSFYRR